MESDSQKKCRACKGTGRTEAKQQSQNLLAPIMVPCESCVGTGTQPTDEPKTLEAKKIIERLDNAIGEREGVDINYYIDRTDDNYSTEQAVQDIESLVRQEVLEALQAVKSEYYVQLAADTGDLNPLHDIPKWEEVIDTEIAKWTK